VRPRRVAVKVGGIITAKARASTVTIQFV